MYLMNPIRYKLKAHVRVLSRHRFGCVHVGTCRRVLRDLGCVGGLVVATLKPRKAAKDSIWAFPQFDQKTWVRCMCLEMGF